MSEMDMIPGDYRQGLSGRRLLRRFIVACVVVLCCIGLARMLLGYLIWRENVQVVHLEQQEQVIEQNKARTEEFRQQKQVTEQQLAALNKLRGRDRVALFLRSIDNVYIEGVWLDSLHFMRRNGTGKLQAPGAVNSGIIVVPNGAETAQSLQINQGAEMIGHAMNHTRLAEFMRNLGKQPTVADLRLIDTGTRNYTNIQVVDFNLSLQLDEKVQEQP
jgi:Tfp pilus assembly protein PilN